MPTLLLFELLWLQGIFIILKVWSNNMRQWTHLRKEAMAREADTVMSVGSWLKSVLELIQLCPTFKQTRRLKKKTAFQKKKTKNSSVYYAFGLFIMLICYKKWKSGWQDKMLSTLMNEIVLYLQTYNKLYFTKLQIGNIFEDDIYASP